MGEWETILAQPWEEVGFRHRFPLVSDAYQAHEQLPNAFRRDGRAESICRKESHKMRGNALILMLRVLLYNQHFGYLKMSVVYQLLSRRRKAPHVIDLTHSDASLCVSALISFREIVRRRRDPLP